MFERKSRDDGGELTSMTHREKDGDRAALGPLSTTARIANILEKNDSGLRSQEVSDLDDGLLNDLEFDDSLGQEI